jgi:hypothetical protein
MEGVTGIHPRVKWIVILAAVLLICNYVHSHDSVQPRIHGTVYDATGAILANASIVAQSWQLDRGKPPRAVISTSCVSDSRGKFELKLPVGVHELLVSYPTMTPIRSQSTP